MKRNLKRVLWLVWLMILVCQNFVFADVISLPSPSESFEPVAILISFIGAGILIILSISFFMLKATIKKQNNENLDSTFNLNDIDEKKRKIQRKFYIVVMILVITGVRYLCLYVTDHCWTTETMNIILFIFRSLCIIFFIVSLFKKKKIINIICVILAILTFITAIGYYGLDKTIRKDNEQFNKYITEDEIERDITYTSDVEKLINTAIHINKFGIKTKIIYENTNYTSVYELKQLLNKINTNKRYGCNTKQNIDLHYMESITLYSEMTTYSFKELVFGSSAKDRINKAKKEIKNNHYNKIFITYISETNQQTTINVREDDVNEISKLIDSDETPLYRNPYKKRYYIYIQTDFNTIYNLMITCNKLEQ